MKIPITLQIALLAVGMTGFYTLVGQAVPQKEVHPPEVIEVAANVTTAELVEIGRTVFEGKGICQTCHTIGKSGALRFPDLQGIAERAARQRPGYTQLDYLAESLYEPDAFIVPGFVAGMQPANRPPIGLSDVEILAVIAYLQTLGGAATVTVDTKFVYTGGAREQDAAEAATEAVADAAGSEDEEPSDLASGEAAEAEAAGDRAGGDDG